MGQSPKTSRFSRRGLVYFRLRQLFCSTLACVALISGERTSLLVGAAYNERRFVRGNERETTSLSLPHNPEQEQVNGT